MKQYLKTLAVGLALTTALSACASGRQHTVTLQSPIIVATAPPAPYETILLQPREGYIIQNGYWDYSHGEHRWVAARYVRERRDYRFQQGGWELMPDGRYRLSRSGFERDQRLGYDSDKR